MKMETTNPGGSSKDRPALEMIAAAERDGLLRPGGHHRRADERQHGRRARDRRRPARLPVRVRHDRQGRAGEGLAAEGVRRRGRRLPGRRRARRSAELLLGRRPPHRRARRLPAQPVRQPEQPAGPRAARPGPSCGARRRAASPTSSPAPARAARSPATARYLKAQNPDVRIIAADPEGSVFSGGSGRPYLVEGVGEDFFPAAWERRPLRRGDRHQRPGELPHRPAGERGGGHPDRRVGRHGRRRRASRSARRAGPDDIVVVLNPDSGRGYLSRVFDDEWMANYGFVTECEQCVGAVLDVRGDARRPALRQPAAAGAGGDRADAGQRASASCRCARTRRRSPPPRCRAPSTSSS